MKWNKFLGYKKNTVLIDININQSFKIYIMICICKIYKTNM